MTDISRHFNGIIKILLSAKNHVVIPDQYSYIDKNIWDQIRHYLPDSYLLSEVALLNDTGYHYVLRKESLHNVAGCSNRLMRLCILDKSLAEKLPHDNYSNHVDSALMMIEANSLYKDPDDLRSYINFVQTSKVLKRHPKQSQLHFPEKPPVGQRREKFPKYRLPLTVWVFHHIQDYVLSSVPGQQRHKKVYTRDEYIALLMEELESISISVRPDFIYATGYDLLYRNPLLEQRPLTGYDIGLSKIEPLRKPRRCVDCGEKYLQEHFFYDDRCVRCGDIAYRQRQQ